MNRKHRARKGKEREGGIPKRSGSTKDEAPLLGNSISKKIE